MRSQLWCCEVSGPRLRGPGVSSRSRGGGGLQGQAHFHFNNVHFVPVDKRPTYCWWKTGKPKGDSALEEGEGGWNWLPALWKQNPVTLSGLLQEAEARPASSCFPMGSHIAPSPIPVYSGCSIHALSCLSPAPMVGVSCPLPGVLCKHLLSINCVLAI